jgi:hypothetical protein
MFLFPAGLRYELGFNVGDTLLVDGHILILASMFHGEGCRGEQRIVVIYGHPTLLSVRCEGWFSSGHSDSRLFEEDWDTVAVQRSRVRNS